MTPRLSDDQVDAIRIAPVPDPADRRLCRVEGTPDDATLRALLEPQRWRLLRYWLRALGQGLGGESDDLGFSLDTDEDWPEDEAFTGVKVFAPWDDEVLLGREAFDRLMARFYRCVVESAKHRNDPATREEWWPAFERAALELGDAPA